jgi:hypothetical protein
VKRAAIAVFLLLACQRHAPPAEIKGVVHVTTTNKPSDERRAKEKDLVRPGTWRFLESAKLGTKLGADGAVAEETFAFPQGQPIYFTLNLRESPVGLQTHVVWLDAKDKQLGKELHPMNGAKTVTFAMKTPLEPGVYRVEGYWGGNFAAEKTFEVVAAKKR